jgi:NAD+--asparagine ADP-ribosyltransferase
VNLFYDGLTKPPSFHVFDNITSAFSTVTNNQSFATFIKNIPGVPVTDLRGAFASFSTSALPQSFLTAVKSEFEVSTLYHVHSHKF